MWEGHGPQFGCRPENVDEAFAIARANFGAVGDSDKVVVAIITKPNVQILPRRNDQRLYEVSCLIVNQEINYNRKKDQRERLTSQAMTVSPGAISRAVDHI